MVGFLDKVFVYGYCFCNCIDCIPFFLTTVDRVSFRKIQPSSQVGWFGIQAEIAGEGLQAILQLNPQWLWTLVNGMLVTLVAAFGFRYIVGVAWITGPAFFIVVMWSSAVSIQDPSLMKEQKVHDPELSLLQGTGIVVGGYIVASLIFSNVCGCFKGSAWA